jgi:hypothetical protein
MLDGIPQADGPGVLDQKQSCWTLVGTSGSGLLDIVLREQTQQITSRGPGSVASSLAKSLGFLVANQA